LEFILDVIRKLTSGKFKVQTYYAILDLLVNELRKRRAAYSDFYQKLEVFLQSADMSSTEIVNCTKRLVESYPYDILRLVVVVSVCKLVLGLFNRCR